MRKHLADMARRVAVVEDALADTYEQRAQRSPDRAEMFRARIAAARQFATAEREIAERYEAWLEDTPTRSSERSAR